MITPSEQETLDAHGSYISKFVVARKMVETRFVVILYYFTAKKLLTIRRRVSAQDLADFARFDSSFVWDRFPSHTHVLTVHGLKDQIVPSYVQGPSIPDAA